MDIIDYMWGGLVRPIKLAVCSAISVNITDVYSNIAKHDTRRHDRMLANTCIYKHFFLLLYPASNKLYTLRPFETKFDIVMSCCFP